MIIRISRVRFPLGNAMRLSSRTRSWLTYSTVVLAFLTGVAEYVRMDALVVVVLVVAIFLVGIILALDNRGILESERSDLEGKIVSEALMVLDRLIVVAAEPILCAVWSSRDEGFKTGALGDQDYAKWKVFYDNVEARNRYFTPRGGFAFPEVEKFAHACFSSFFIVYDELSWVRDSIPQTAITSLLSRAKQSAWTSGFTRD